MAQRMPNPTFEKPIKTLLGLKDAEFKDIVTHKKELKDAGFPKAEYLIKPVDLHLLMETVKKMMNI